MILEQVLTAQSSISDQLNFSNAPHWAPGVFYFAPEQIDEHVPIAILSAGIHGNETAPIELLANKIEQIQAGKIKLKTPVLFIFGNVDSMKVAERFVETNLNRLFHFPEQSPQPKNKEQHRALLIQDAVKAFRERYPVQKCWHLDLHTAIRASQHEKFAIMPYDYQTESAVDDPIFTSLLVRSGVEVQLKSDNPTSTFSFYTVNALGAQSATVELGQVKPFGQNDLTKLAALSDVLTNWLEGNTEDGGLAATNFQSCQTIHKTSEHFSLSFDNQLANFTEFKKGDLLATDNKREYRAMYDGEAIVFPNANVEIGHRALLTVIRTKIEN
ncbi:succinylglutamate desuccinylase [Catenovulum sp. SM1970]|uniref:succinylglutamate desuccinylase n=1 Tax=Marinifaba aquimaris TaxID=2741323 RepID=UPI001572F545|nr:succinylglutamate desuccinylase [Marinifaba aquimaris]NTS76091.1 succinylglutamate desuccinylase [Marinifaba aquimaris]